MSVERANWVDGKDRTNNRPKIIVAKILDFKDNQKLLEIVNK